MVAIAVLAFTLALSATQSSQIDGIVSSVMRDHAITGCTMGVARARKSLVVRGYGASDADTVYRIGSLTKQFTAALVLRAIASHQFNDDTAVHGATVAELLNQTSGIPNYSPGTRTLEEALRAPLAFTPGTEWAYSNTNYVLLASLLEMRTQTPFAQLVRNELRVPLALNDTSAEHAHGDLGMTSTVPNLLTWLDALESGRVVSEQDFLRMGTPAELSDGTPTSYGDAFFIRNWYGWKVLEHPGYEDGASADDALVPDDHLAVVALCNRGAVSLEPLVKSIVAILEPARDQALVAKLDAAPENENPAVRRKAEELVATLELGAPQTFEFLSRITTATERRERYRVTFKHARYRLTLIYRSGRFDDATIQPDGSP